MQVITVSVAAIDAALAAALAAAAAAAAAPTVAGPRWSLDLQLRGCWV